MELGEKIKLLAEGDMSAFEAIYREMKGAVYHVALSVVKERSLAEDVMHSCFLRVIKYAAQFQEGTNAKAWILRIARNEALNLIKRRAREHSVDVTQNPETFGSHSHDYGILTDFARTHLEEEEFTIVMLAAADGYKRREIAEILKIPLPTVTWKYHRAMKKLREILEKEGMR